jgi:hypothetical protein
MAISTALSPLSTRLIINISARIVIKSNIDASFPGVFQWGVLMGPVVVAK